MPRASIVWTSWTIAALCWKPSIIKGFSQGHSPLPSPSLTRSTMTSFWSSSGWRPSCRPTSLRHVRSPADKRAAEEIANRQKSDDFEQAVVRTGLERTQRGPAADKGVRTKVRDLAGLVLYPGWPESLCRSDGGALYQQTRVVRTENSNPNVMMVKSAEDWERADCSSALDRTRLRSVLV